MGLIMQGSARNEWTGILFVYGSEIPHYPGITVCAPARIPPPQRLSGDPESDAFACLGAYESVRAALYARPFRGLPRRALASLPAGQRKAVDRAAEVLYTAGTQPQVWCAWALRWWARWGPARWRRSAPTLLWVYGPARLSRAKDFVSASGGAETSARLIYAPAHVELIRKWEAMRAALLGAGELDVGKVRSIVDKTLSLGVYQRLVLRAELQTKMKQEQIDLSVENGEYLWG